MSSALTRSTQFGNRGRGHGESSFGSGSGDGSQRQRVVKNLGTHISAIGGMIKSACFVGARWSWHRDFPGI